jgi:acetyl-CoA acyltransferase
MSVPKEKSPRDAVIVECVRTPFGRAHAEKGYFRETRGDDLAVHVVRELIRRSGIDPSAVEDVVLGCTQQVGEQGLNLGRSVALMAGLGTAVGGATVNRLCGSSLQALNQAAHAIQAGAEDVHIVGGVEHMHHLPMDHAIDVNPRLFAATSRGALHMGITAEYLAQTHGIFRADQDAFALRSHQLASAAQQTSHIAGQIVPTYALNEKSETVLVTQDQTVRPNASAEALAALSPAFVPVFGTVTAGNSSPLSDGAAALLLMSRKKASELGCRPLARVVATAVAGVEACLMGTGPIPATRKVLKRAVMQLSDLDLVELNEAFAAQALYCIRTLGLDMEKVNVAGGAIAIGHPLGASGARIAMSLVRNLRARGGRYGLATMCIGLGQGIATILENESST